MVSGVKNVSMKQRSFSVLPFMKFLPTLCCMMMIGACVSGKVSNQDAVSSYQEILAERGPQERSGVEGLESISPVPDPRLPVLEEMKDPSGKTIINLALENAVVRTLANSPEITVVSYDPSISRENVGVAASEFDITAFGQFGYDEFDSPSNDIFESGQSQSSLWEAGIRQKGVTGAEWSLSYAMTRSFDESQTRIFTTSYEPALTFELKQPLLRDAWMDINLADVNISKLNYKIAFSSFRQKAEEVATQVISLYWTLLQARRDVEIQKSLLDRTIETLRKVEDRKHIDATLGDIKQAEAAVKSREAALFETEKNLADVQDRLVRLLADHQMNMIDDLEIVPISSLNTEIDPFDQTALMKLAIKNNPRIIRAQLETEVAEVNVRVAKKQRMPRLDIVASAQLQGLSDSQGEASEMLNDFDYTNYSLGVTFEYPIGNREKGAAFRLRKLQHSKALSNVQNVSEDVARLVKERIRLAETAHKEIQIQKDAVEAARIYLQTLEDIEVIRKKLTPEFLLAKIQAQDSLANAMRAEIKANVDYNIALVRLAQTTGRVLDLRSVQSAIPVITGIPQPKLIISDVATSHDKRESEESMKSDEVGAITVETGSIREDNDEPGHMKLVAYSEAVAEPPHVKVHATDVPVAVNGTEVKIPDPDQSAKRAPREITKEDTDDVPAEAEVVHLVEPFIKRTTTDQSKYYVQVGSWKNPDYAQEFFVKLKKYYPDIYIEKQNTFSKLRIPGIETRQQGAAITQEIKERFNLHPFLVQKTQ